MVVPKGIIHIERKQNDGNYSSANCKWATKSEQSLNREVKLPKSGYRNIFLVNNSTYSASFVHNGKRHTVSGGYKTAKEAAIAYNAFCDLNNLDRRRINVD